MNYATRTGSRSHVEGYVRGRQTSGFRFGPGNWRDSPSKAEFNPAITVPGESIADRGFELTTYDGVFVAWHECPLDAIDAMKVFEGPCKIIRCSDRVLIKHRPPRRNRL